jgi:hypothetical protein
LTPSITVIRYWQEVRIMKNEIDWENAFLLFAFVGCPMLAIVSVLASNMAG